MKVTIASLILLLCNLNASQFLSQDLLERSLEVPDHFGRSVGTFFLTDTHELIDITVGPVIDPVAEIYAAQILPKDFRMVTGTCVAISPRHFLTSSEIFELLQNKGDCFVSMTREMAVEELQAALFLEPLFRKVQKRYLEPTDGELVILELAPEFEDLQIPPLPLRLFDARGEVMGISTAHPALLGTPIGLAKSIHKFYHSNLLRNKNGLEAWFILPKPFTPGMGADLDVANTLDMIRSGTIPAGSVRPAGERNTSIFANGDSGAPLLQDGHVVAVCGGWSLRAGSLGEVGKEEPVYVLANQFIPVAPYIPWIESVLQGKDGGLGDRTGAEQAG